MSALTSIELVSDSAYLVRFADQPSLEASDRVLRFFYRLVQRVQGLDGIHPAYASVLVDFDPLKFDPEALRRELEMVLLESKRQHAVPGEIVTVPVVYDGPDLDEVAKLTGLTTDEVIRLHTGVEYKVAFLGFSPGFPYLLGLPQRLLCPRKNEPRLKVPAGSVAIAGKQAGIYPRESPGGWQILGRTDLELFSPHRSPPTLLKPGHRVVFQKHPSRKKPKAGKIAKPVASGTPAFEILVNGFMTSVQDTGRKDQVHLGISRGGAADPLALRVGNLLLGNPEDAAALEMTVQGASVRVLRDTWLAVTGSESEVDLDGKPLEMWAAHPVRAGQTLTIGAIGKFRAYINFRGGVAAGNSLGDEPEGHPIYRPSSKLLRRMYAEDLGSLRVTLGPQATGFAQAAVKAFFENKYIVTADVNRLGLRLSGPPLPDMSGEELMSEGVPAGSVQIPGSGQPMILFCEQCTTGGYAKIATVISADLWKLGQLKPGDHVRFHEASIEEAWFFRRELENILIKTGIMT